MPVRLKSLILIAVGSLSLALGVVGIVVPLLPTTPFLLLAAVCYLHSSPRLHRWLLENRLLGVYLRHYYDGSGMPRRAKIVALTLLWLTIGCSVVCFVANVYVRVGLVLMAIAVTAHILSIRPRPNR